MLERRQKIRVNRKMSAGGKDYKTLNPLMTLVENGWGRAEELRQPRQKVSQAKIWAENFQSERTASAKDSKKD